MPGVLQIEAMAQCGGILALRSVPDPENYLTFFMKIENAKFKNQVVPGDTLIFSLKLVAPIRRGICHMDGIIYANNKIVWDINLLEEHGIKRYPFGTEGELTLICKKRNDESEKPQIVFESDIPLTLEVIWGKTGQKQSKIYQK